MSKNTASKEIQPLSINMRDVELREMMLMNGFWGI